MTATSVESSLSPVSSQPFFGAAHLIVRREDITWSLLGDRLQIEVNVHNASTQRESIPTTMRIEAAPLGAFVDWRPLTAARVPAIPPSESRVVRTTVQAPAFGMQMPQRPPFGGPLLSFPNDDRRLTRFGRLVYRVQDRVPLLRRLGIGRLARLGEQPSDGPFYWIGNLNVWVDPGIAVERHRAERLRVMPGVQNFALFVVGSELEYDEYCFRIGGSCVDAWKARLSPWLRSEEGVIEPGMWLLSEPNQPLTVCLCMTPPETAQSGSIVVYVQKRSTKTHTCVEFTFDADAQGPGCYVA